MTTKDGEEASQTQEVTSLNYVEEGVLRYLAERAEPVENLTLIAIAVREQERCKRGREYLNIQIPDVEQELTATHLSKLEREGLISYNRGTKTVSMNATDEEIQQYLDSA